MNNLLLKVYIELRAKALNRPFDYLYSGETDLKPGMRVRVNFNNSPRIGYVTEVIELNLQTLSEKKNLKSIIEVIDTEPIISPQLFSVLESLSEKNYVPLIQMIQTALPPSLKPASSSLKAPKLAYQGYVVASSILAGGTKLTPKQRNVYDRIQSGEEIPKNSVSSSVLNSLLDKKLVTLIYKEKDRLNINEKIIAVSNSNVKLTDDQLRVCDKVFRDPYNTFLLQGVTGSGKTEVYLELAKRMLFKNKTSLIIVSEISLTPQMMGICKARFGNAIALLHSGLKPSERLDQYRKIYKGEVSIIIGARSAIFAPIQNLGLIVIDEEHSPTYHQETFPYYQTQDVAELIQSNGEGIKLIYGSATPSLLTASKAKKGVIGHLELSNRVNKKELPLVSIVNMNDSTNYSGNTYFISKQTREEIEKTVSNKEQVMVLVNRRGFASYLTCQKCRSVVRCEKCGRALKYHKGANCLKCHACETKTLYPRFCKDCGSVHFDNMGFGTETVEEELKKMFVNARISRIDSDSISEDSSVSKILNEFSNGEIDILVGTQMIAKGHDFPNVTLSVVVAGDLELNLPNYYAAESVFNLIYQTIGRAGRGNKQGKAVIQTYNPHHYAVVSAAQQNYEQFYLNEMRIRKISKFPPYWYLSLVHVYAKDEVDIEVFSNEIVENLNSVLEHNKENVIITGSYDPYITFNGPYRKKNILLRYKKESDVKEALKTLMKAGNTSPKVKIDIEVNPIHLF